VETILQGRPLNTGKIGIGGILQSLRNGQKRTSKRHRSPSVSKRLLRTEGIADSRRCLLFLNHTRRAESIGKTSSFLPERKQAASRAQLFKSKKCRRGERGQAREKKKTKEGKRGLSAPKGGGKPLSRSGLMIFSGGITARKLSLLYEGTPRGNRRPRNAKRIGGEKSIN